GATNSGYNSTGSQSGYYSVKITDANGCSDVSDSIHITRLPSPQATITVVTPVNNPDLCINGSVKLRANQTSGLTWQWYYNNALIPGATDRNYIVTTSNTGAGSYTVKTTYTPSGCTKTSVPTAVFSSCNIENAAAPMLNVYPNP